MKINKKTFWVLIIPIVVVSPMILSAILNIPTGKYAIGDESSWVGFFGNYSGGIIGGIIAFIIARGQIKENRDEIELSEREKSRSYIILEEFIAPVKLENVITHNNSKILSNDYYEQIKNDPGAKEMSIAFFKIHHSGLPEIILDCEIGVELRGGIESNPTTSPYLIESHISVLEKGTEIFIPLANKEHQYIYPNGVSISYKTIKGEKIRYSYDVGKMEEKHELINEDGTLLLLYKVNLKGVKWIYPAKFKSIKKNPPTEQICNGPTTNNYNFNSRKAHSKRRRRI